jgi:hypothetical protein
MKTCFLIAFSLASGYEFLGSFPVGAQRHVDLQGTRFVCSPLTTQPIPSAGYQYRLPVSHSSAPVQMIRVGNQMVQCRQIDELAPDYSRQVMNVPLQEFHEHRQIQIPRQREFEFQFEQEEEEKEDDEKCFQVEGEICHIKESECKCKKTSDSDNEIQRDVKISKETSIEFDSSRITKILKELGKDVGTEQTLTPEQRLYQQCMTLRKEKTMPQMQQMYLNHCAAHFPTLQ